jgi:NTP pyrophosphatase (non-canonical NTP hydrolase)
VTKQRKHLMAVAAERDRQDLLWGEQNHSQAVWYAILGEEFGEVGRAINEGDVAGYKAELIQLAAVAVAMVESLERNPIFLDDDGTADDLVILQAVAANA